MTDGDTLPELVRGPITRGTLALFAGASHDHVLLHIDSDFAKAAGMNDVFAHGMLSMAYLAQALRDWAPGARIRHWNVRFTAITPLHSTVHCFGEVVETFQEDSGRSARLKVGARTDQGIRTLDGEAIIAID
ncbi:dehydratase [Sphingomonas sp. So64.6b]|uniref:MaoC/PaaZ C-terminal domain-containing protein n=1 Tax=Sphingomonas sp. So64.6b TaxID=2997354 RepID=UPI001602243A|nr:MaoC/PaaZ C-terminal domain-containing protein [Sphingomonas sp. So64.6b]QNA85535.1 dehydratase [Sphingomonas sp. So64.6b]